MANIKITTCGELKDHLLMVMDHANDEPTKGNRSISKEKYWNMIMKICIDNGDEEECGEITANAVLREFPEYLRPDFKP